MTPKVGNKIRMDGEWQRYTVQAANDRFCVMTKPFNARRTYLYTITDRQRGVRGPCNLVFGLPCDVNNPEGAKRVLGMLDRGNIEVSYRNSVKLTASEIAQLDV